MIHQSICEHTPEIMAHFERISEDEPWVHLPADLRLDGLPDVLWQISALALLRPRDPEAGLVMVHSAAAHGEERRRQAFHDGVLFREYYLLREALWRFLLEYHGGGSPGTFAAIVRVDAALSLATKASMRGYHRAAFEAQGRWPSALDDIAREWIGM